MERPAPNPSRDSAFFWEGCEREVLLAQRCTSCKTFRFPLRPMCPHCHSLDWEAVECSGRGTLHSWSKPVHPALPMFEPGYLVALTDLEEGVRMLSNLCDIEPSDIENDMAVEVFFAPTAGGKKVHQWRPAGGAGA